MWRWLLKAGGLALGVAGAAQAHPNLIVEAAHVQAPPVVDGDLGEWSGARWLALAPGDSLVGVGT